VVNLVTRFTSTGFLFQTPDKNILILGTSTSIVYDKIAGSITKSTSIKSHLSSTSFILSRLFFDNLMEPYEDLEHCFCSILPKINKYSEHIIYLADFQS